MADTTALEQSIRNVLEELIRKNDTASLTIYTRATRKLITAKNAAEDGKSSYYVELTNEFILFALDLFNRGYVNGLMCETNVTKLKEEIKREILEELNADPPCTQYRTKRPPKKFDHMDELYSTMILVYAFLFKRIMDPMTLPAHVDMILDDLP
jgi:hypothetical protein